MDGYELEGTTVATAWVDTSSGVDIGTKQASEDTKLILVPCQVAMVPMAIFGLQRKFAWFPH
jgi:hypothetical protein